MFYLPPSVEVPRLERRVIDAFVRGDFSLSQELMLQVVDPKLVYLMHYIKLLLPLKKAPWTTQRIAMAGDSHCLSAGWEVVGFKHLPVYVRPYYYLDMSITSFQHYADSVRDFLDRIEERHVVLSCGSLDIYEGGKLHKASAHEYQRACSEMCYVLSTYKNKTFYVTGVSSGVGGIDPSDLNRALYRACARFGFMYLPIDKIRCGYIDNRHFSPQFIQHLLEGIR